MSSQAVRVLLLSLLCGIAVVGCTTFDPTHRSEIIFSTTATNEQVQAAAKSAAERLGGQMVERAISSPTSAGGDSTRRDLGGYSVGFFAPLAGYTLDTLIYKPITSDSALVIMHGFLPYMAATAIAEELDYPRSLYTATERHATTPPLTIKSKLLFSALSLLSPSIGATYLLINNPFGKDASEVMSILVPLVIDAGALFFYITEKGTSRPGLGVLGLAAVYMRLSGLFGLSAEVDRYNMLAMSGYHIGLEDINYNLSSRFTFHVRIK
jgi:hypothetical protein